MASRVLGMGDVLSLIEDAPAPKLITEKPKSSPKKCKSGKGFDSTIQDAMVQMRKDSGIAALMDKLARANTPGSTGAKVDDKAVNRLEGIINSMTPLERSKPGTHQSSRKRRIAMGAGCRSCTSTTAQPV